MTWNSFDINDRIGGATPEVKVRHLAFDIEISELWSRADNFSDISLAPN